MCMRMSCLAGKVVVITGGSAGIGAGCALEFAKNGCNVVITGRNKTTLDDVAKQCLEAGAPEVLPVIVEITSDDDVKALVRQTLDKFGTVHVLLNNAGGGRASDAMDLRACAGDTDSMDYQYKVTVRAPWQLSGLLVHELVKNKGCIINISSVFGNISTPEMPAYGTMKAAMNYMTRCMATELGMHGVRVNAVLPGVTVTSDLRNLAPADKHQDVYETLARACHVLEQKVLYPVDVAKTVVFLASDAASRITGVTLPVDGGCMLGSPAYDFAGSQAIPGLEQNK